NASELLIDGDRAEFERLASLARDLFTDSDRLESSLNVESVGDVPIQRIVIRKGPPPNRVHYEPGVAIFSVSPTLLRPFISYIEFPQDSELPNSPIQYHHHYDGIGNEGFVAADSIPVVFALKRHS